MLCGKDKASHPCGICFACKLQRVSFELSEGANKTAKRHAFLLC